MIHTMCYSFCQASRVDACLSVVYRHEARHENALSSRTPDIFWIMSRDVALCIRCLFILFSIIDNMIENQWILKDIQRVITRPSGTPLHFFH